MNHFQNALELQKRHSRITFKVISENENEVVVRVTQNRNPNGNHFSAERLVEITKELYALKNETRTLIIHSVPYIEPPADKIDTDWIKAQMKKYKIGSKKLVEDLGIAKSEISSLINNKREMGIRTKGLFYYYFLSQQI